MFEDSKCNTLLLGNSFVAGLSRYPNVWNEYLAPINGLNSDIEGDRVKNILLWVIDLLLSFSVKNNVILCQTNNIPIDTPCETASLADCIVSIGLIFRKKSNGVYFSVCGLIPLDECWSVNRLLINEVNEILRCQCNIYGFGFIFQDHAWNLANGSLDDFSLIYRDLLHLIEQDNVKLAESITLTITSWYNHIYLFSTNINTSYSDITRQKCSIYYFFFVKWAWLFTII